MTKEILTLVTVIHVFYMLLEREIDEVTLETALRELFLFLKNR